MVKPPLRTKSIGFKVSEEEYAQLETAAQAAFGPFVTQESLTSTLFGGVIGWILGKSIPAIGQGLAVSQVARFDAKALNYNVTLQGCRQASGIGGLAQAISFTP